MALVSETGGDAEQVEQDLRLMREDSRKQRKLDAQKALRMTADGMSIGEDEDDVECDGW